MYIYIYIHIDLTELCAYVRNFCIKYLILTQIVYVIYSLYIQNKYIQHVNIYKYTLQIKPMIQTCNM